MFGAVVLRGHPASGLHDGQPESAIAIIDFYGLHQCRRQARSALTVKEGDTIVIAGDAPPAFVRIEATPLDPAWRAER